MNYKTNFTVYNI